MSHSGSVVKFLKVTAEGNLSESAADDQLAVGGIYLNDPNAGITSPSGEILFDDFVVKNKDNIIQALASLLFQQIQNNPDQLDSFRLPQIVDKPTATPTTPGKGYVVYSEKYRKNYAWTGAKWEDQRPDGFKDVIYEDETVEILQDHQLILKEQMTVRGDLLVNGTLYVIDDYYADTYEQATDIVLDSRLDALEAAAAAQTTIEFSYETYILTAQDITDGYVELAHEAISNSVNAFIDRLAIHENSDYTVSVVGGVTRLTFVDSLVTVNQEKLYPGDVIRVKYAYLIV